MWCDKVWCTLVDEPLDFYFFVLANASWTVILIVPLVCQKGLWNGLVEVRLAWFHQCWVHESWWRVGTKHFRASLGIISLRVHVIVTISLLDLLEYLVFISTRLGSLKHGSLIHELLLNRIAELRGGVLVAAIQDGYWVGGKYRVVCAQSSPLLYTVSLNLQLAVGVRRCNHPWHLRVAVKPLVLRAIGTLEIGLQ